MVLVVTTSCCSVGEMYAAWYTVWQPNRTVWVLWCCLWHYLCHLVVLLQSPWLQCLPQIFGYHLARVVLQEIFDKMGCQAQVRFMWCSFITCLWLFQNRGHYKACFLFCSGISPYTWQLKLRHVLVARHYIPWVQGAGLFSEPHFFNRVHIRPWPYKCVS